MNFVCFNGDLFPSSQALFTVQNRSFKYGDGIFETIKVFRGKIPLASLHFERLFLSLQLLKIHPSFNQEQLTKKLMELCEKNDCQELARVRLAVYRNEYNGSGFVMEALSLPESVNELNESGFAIDLYPYARKSKDAFSNLKSANFLPYVLADLYAQEKNLDDSVVLNCDSLLCDTSKANIFLIKDHEIFTPALHQGCINGVMRRFLIDELKKQNYKIHQEEISETDLVQADEVFLTNAIYGMRWVRSFREKQYSNRLTTSIYQQVVSSILCK